MIKKSLVFLSKRFAFFAWAKTAYVTLRNKIFGFYLKFLKVNDHLIIFEAYHGSKYACSPKAIYEFILNDPKYENYKFIWSFEDPKKYSWLQNERTHIVKHESIEYFKAFASSKYWVVNGWINLNIKKKANQIAVQCWHGTPLKRLRYDIPESVGTDHRSNILNENDADIVRYDYFVSPSRFASDAFTSSFNLKNLGKQDIVVETGYPRNDFLKKYTKKDVQKVKDKLDIPTDKKILLYAPTWRDDQKKPGGGYEYKSPVDFKFLADTLADEYTMLFRGHNLAETKIDFQKYKDFIIDASDVDDINELYIVSDILITDYSSVFFDYSNLNRPIVFFMYDKEHYENDLRGFYLDMSELPGQIVENEKDLVKSIKEMKPSGQKQISFNKKFNYLEDGNAAKRVAETMINHRGKQ